ncbi:MAG: two-component system, chemotaxis family, sensor kinase CheA [Blastocatellia bacterium]|jgi:two-component system chemotaxis sensor kinase CheA|nr:two-component system, chemotaxis family, sensor kinase CheA [Blastocatellia bacterium]
MDELLREFLAEAEELIETLFRDIRQLGEKRDEGRARRELTNRIFRYAHTLKGTAAAAGLDVASQLAHEFETLLDAVRLGQVNINEPVLVAFEDAAHALSQTLGAAARNERSPLPLTLIKHLRQLAHGDDLAHGDADDSQRVLHQDSAAPLSFLPEEIALSLGASDAQRVREAMAEGQRLFLVHVAFDLETFEQSFRGLSAALAGSGELISTLPGLAEAAPGAINLRLLCATQANEVEFAALVEPFGLAALEEFKAEASSRGEGDAAREVDEDVATLSAAAETIAPMTTQVRVELGKLDELINAANELLTETTAALNLARDASRRAPTALEALDARSSLIHQRFIELEDQLIALRRVPLAQTLERAARAGRQAARATGKELEVEITGGEVRLDKSLVEVVSDPLLHLVRNAVGHGLESAAERASAGKPARGALRLDATAEDDRVILRITDDGRGLNLESIARAASERGIIAAGQSITRHQALRLIFRPGFSTAPVVSKISGRGVGLDVVERAIEQVGGEMRVSSAPGQGTTFEMIIPTALSLVSALVVASAGFSYCLDAGHVAETLIVADEEIERASDEENDEEFVTLRGERLPLVRLRQLLGQPPLEATESAVSWPVVIVSRARRTKGKDAGATQEGGRVALQVDGWTEGLTELLVRRLGAHGLRWQGVSGAAELSGGNLALVLDVHRLLETYGAS